MTDYLEIKAAITVDEAGTITGIAWPFGSADDLGDVIEKGAFSAPATLPMLFAHDQGQAVGVWDAIAESDQGLTVKGRLLVNDISRAKEVRALIREKAVTGLSIGFITKEAKSRPGGGRTITKADLREISIVAVPAHPGARITAIKAAGAAHQEESTMDKGTTAAAPDLAAIETKLAEVEAKAAATDKLTERLDKIEARLNRPPANGNDNKAEKHEIKAFLAYARLGVERMPAEEVKSLTVSSDPGGGYLAPDQFVAEIIRNLVEISPVRQAARIMQTGAGSVILPKRTGTITAAWVGETEDRPATEPAYGQVEIPTHEAACYIDVSSRLLEDAAINLESELAFDFAEEFGRLEGVAFISGSGVKQPTGLLTATIDEVNSGNASALTADGLIDLMHDLPAFYRNRGVWMMNGSTVGAVRKLKASGTGEYLWRDSLAEGNPPTVLGRPVIEAPDMPDVAANAFPVLFGAFADAYRIVDRINLSVLRDPYSQATKGLVRFHARRRVGGAVVKAEALRKLKIAA